MSGGVFLLVLLMLGIIGLVGGTAVGNWILAPLQIRCKMVAKPTQFHMIDLLCLFVVLQIPLAWVGMTVSVFGLGGAGGLSAILAVYFGLVWWAGVRKLSQAGIENPWHRGLFLVLVFPGTLFGTIVSVLLAIAVFLMVLCGVWNDPPGIGLTLSAIELGLALCLYGFGRFTRWIVATASADDAEQ